MTAAPAPRPIAPVLILQFMPDDAPAYLGTWLAASGIEAEIRVAGTDDFPVDLKGRQALALLGGSMSVNDDLAFLRQAERLIDQAFTAEVPVIGHCLGGQLMARALGAEVGSSPRPEVGWHRMDCTPQGRDWFGAAEAHTVFHWHYEAFAMPKAAVLLGSNERCPHQAFSYGPHLALQFHLEVDARKVDLWLSQQDAQYLAQQRAWDTVHSEARIRDDSAAFLRPQQMLADRVYARWAQTAGLISP